MGDGRDAEGVLIVHRTKSRLGKVDDGGRLPDGRTVVDAYKQSLQDGWQRERPASASAPDMIETQVPTSAVVTTPSPSQSPQQAGVGPGVATVGVGVGPDGVAVAPAVDVGVGAFTVMVAPVAVPIADPRVLTTVTSVVRDGSVVSNVSGVDAVAARPVKYTLMTTKEFVG